VIVFLHSTGGLGRDVEASNAGGFTLEQLIISRDPAPAGHEWGLGGSPNQGVLCGIAQWLARKVPSSFAPACRPADAISIIHVTRESRSNGWSFCSQ
jgi:hypothetical protein